MTNRHGNNQWGDQNQNQQRWTPRSNPEDMVDKLVSFQEKSDKLKRFFRQIFEAR